VQLHSIVGETALYHICSLVVDNWVVVLEGSWFQAPALVDTQQAVAVDIHRFADDTDLVVVPWSG
jgi:hypothetical protein